MRPGFLLAFLAVNASLFAADNDLPKKSAAAAAGSDSALFRDDGSDPLFPNTKLTDTEFLNRLEPPSLEKATTAYEQARRKAERWEKLAKSGVLAQIEVERATLQAARARVRLEQARVVQQQSDLADLRSRAASDKLPADAVRSAEGAVQTAQAAAAEAEAALKRTEVLFAEANVDRQRRLLAMGAGSKSQLKQAEQALLQLQNAPR